MIDLIRGKQVVEAKAILMTTPKAATEPVMKLLNSAIANAEKTIKISRGYVVCCRSVCGYGPDLKKVPAARPGQSFQDPQENKPYNHYIGSGEIRR